MTTELMTEMKYKNLILKYHYLSEPAKAAIWYAICNVLNKGLALLSTPIFTRIMTAEQYGTYAIFQSWYNIIIIFTSLNIFLGGYLKGLLLYRYDRPSFISSLLSLTTFITVVVGLIYVLFIDFWTSLFQLPPILMGAMFVELTFIPALEFWAASERFEFKYQKYVAVSIAMTILSLGFGVLSVLNTSYKVEARIISDIGVKSVFAGVLFMYILFKGKKYFDNEYWCYALKFNLPLLPHYLSNYVLSQSDGIMIGRMVGNDKAAFYSVAYTISMATLLIMNAINNSLTPYLYKQIDYYEQKKSSIDELSYNIQRVTNPLIVLVAFMSTTMMVFAPEVISVFAGPRYDEAIYVIPPIAASVFFIFLYSLFSNIEYYFQKTGSIAVATTISAILNLILNYVFIDMFGYYAAGFTTLFCYVGLSLMHYYFYRKALAVILPNCRALYNIKLIILVSAAILCIMLLMSFTYELTSIRYGFVVAVMFIIFYKRQFIVSNLNVLIK